LAEPLIISTSKRDDHQLEMTIQLGPERTEEALHRAAKQVSKRAKIPGFRPGKAPYGTVLRMFGRDALLGQVMEEMGDEIYKEALEVEHIDPYGRADLEDVTTDPVTFKLTVPLQPEAHLGDYRSIRIPAVEVTTTDADVDEVLERAADQRATSQVVDRAAALGDTVVVDIVGKVDEETIMDNHDWEVKLEGGDSGWLPGFDDAFVMMAAEDEKTFSLTYPEDSTSRYHGQEVTFHATVKEVRAKVRPPMDDEFARSLGDYADLADLRTKTREEITRQRDADAKEELNNKAIDALIEQSTFAYPDAAVTDSIAEMLSDLEMRVSQGGYNLQDFLLLQGTTVESYGETLRPVAERQLKGRLALAELAKAEGIAVTPEETEAEVERLVAGAVDERRAKAARDTLGSESGQWLVNRDLQNRKAIRRLVEIVTDPTPPPVGAGVQKPLAQPESAAEDSDADAVAAAPPAPAEEPKKKKRRTKKTAESRDVGGAESRDVGGAESRDVGGAESRDVGGAESREAGEAESREAGGAQSRGVEATEEIERIDET
jgi:trigger factor